MKIILILIHLLFLKNIQIFDLIKLDTQGSELDILKGGVNLVQRSKAIILEVSHQSYNQDSPLVNEVIEYMTDINFLLKETLDTQVVAKKQLALGKTRQSDYLFPSDFSRWPLAS